ncbi:hypothetical protein [Aegicerativicinus sediminis]|uniref:hypothetical protein n=1 Tax=Aegicerativicinus sediminis TaxID=2893202 RepID=UPI001E3DB6F7|nr:hypothetical protein [Aegicerativicinus sediminis]
MKPKLTNSDYSWKNLKTFFFRKMKNPKRKPKILTASIFLTVLVFSALFIGQKTNQRFLEPTLIFEDANNTLAEVISGEDKWETVETYELTLNANSETTNMMSPPPPTKLSLEQVRNGSGDSPLVNVDWQNGNAGASNAHYVEGWGIPYRAIITNIPAGTHSIDIAWDIKHSSANAIDFIGYYDLLDYEPGTHAANFNHLKETIDPTSGYSGMGLESTADIPEPDFSGVPNDALNTFNAIKSDNLAKMAIWNGTINSMTYVSQGDLAAASSTTVLRIVFTTDGGDLILSWSGHIAKKTDWGDGNSASAVSGSPYHSRILQWDEGNNGDFTSVGNQDRSLSAAAVINPPPCNVAGPGLVCPSSTGHVYENDAVLPNSTSIIPDGYKYQWSVTGNGNISSGDSGTGAKVSVDAGTGCGISYTVKLTITTTNDVFVTSCEKIVSVEDSTSPTWTTSPGADATIDCPSEPVFTAPTASDECSTATVNEISDVTTPGSCTGTYVRTKTWEAVDDCGNKSSQVTQTITVRDITSPTWTTSPGADATIDCPSEPVFTAPTASDECSTATVNEISDVTTPGSCTGTYVRTKTWEAVDDCGNKSSQVTQTITVRDITSPTWTTSPGADATIDCPSEPVFTAPTASDECSTATVNEISDVTTPGSCTGTYVRTKTWEAVDDCGNKSSQVTQTITVRDITSPTWTTSPGADATIDCPSEPVFTAPTASDECSTATVNEISDVTTPGSCTGTYVRTKTWEAVDDCGNKSSQVTQTITVRDITSPTWTTSPGADATIDCPSEPVFTAPTASDECSTATVNEISDVTTPGSCTGTYVRTKTWEAVDDCGNKSSQVTQTITVRDITSPTWTTSPGADATIDCPSEPVFTAPTASDECSTATVNEISDVTTPGSCTGTYVRTKTWEAVDDCGNKSSQVTQTITVRDITSPTWTTSPGADATIDCPSEPVFTAPTASGRVLDSDRERDIRCHDPWLMHRHLRQDQDMGGC